MTFATSARRSQTREQLGFVPSATFGLVVGIATASWLLVLQFLSAWAASMLWSVESWLANALVYPLCGALAGLGVALLVHGSFWILRRRLTLDHPTLLAAVLATGGFALQALVSAGLRSRHLTGGLVGGSVTQIVVWTLLIATCYRLLRWKGFSGIGALRVPAVVVSATMLATAYLFQVVVLGNQGVRRVSLGLVFLLLGLVSLLIATGIVSSSGTIRGPRLLGRMGLAVLALAGIGLAIRAQLPSATRSEGRSRDAGAPNVALIVLDTLRRDAVSAYGLVEGTTPNLDALAARGTLWEDAIAPGNWTIPSHASLFTGALVSRHGSGFHSQALRLKPGGEGTAALPTLAEILSGRGWGTSAFVANGQLSRIRGFARGFERYDEIWKARKGQYDLLAPLTDRWLGRGSFDKGGRRVVQAFDSWLATRAGAKQPWFSFLNFVEPHAPYDPPSPWRESFLEAEDIARVSQYSSFERERAISELRKFRYGGAPEDLTQLSWRLYLGSVKYQDHLIGELLAALETHGQLDNTVVIITSDHGENFGWLGQLTHGVELNDDLIRIPLVAAGPGVASGSRDQTPASLVDLFQTILYLAGVPTPPATPGQPGIVLPPIGAALPDSETRLRVSERRALDTRGESTVVDPFWVPERTALLQGPWKVISVDGHPEGRLSLMQNHPIPPAQDGRVEVDDAARLEQMLMELLQMRGSWIRALEPEGDAGDTPLDDETLEQLKALGYIG